MTTQISVTVTTDSYAITTDSDDDVIDSGGAVILTASGADQVTLTSSIGAPFADMTATSSGTRTTLATSQLNPFALSVDGLSGTPVTITPKFKLVLSTTPPTIVAGVGAKVEVVGPDDADLSITNAKTGDAADLFVDATAHPQLPKDGTAGYVIADIAEATYKISTDSATQAPLKGKINVSVTTNPAPSPG